MIVINGGNLVQSFFVISGFLNSFVFLGYIKNRKWSSFSLLVKTITYRYIRFAPVLLFLVLLHSTWLWRFDIGPFWDKFNFLERQACRTNMWTNLLFINNYVSGDLKCMVHTWFISADFHLSILATGLLLLITWFVSSFDELECCQQLFIISVTRSVETCFCSEPSASR